MTQKRWKRVCKKLGLTVITNRGKGSHYLVKNSQTFTIQSRLFKVANQKIMKQLISMGYTEEQVLEAIR